jgi:cyclophilin family peptidyl-prolyl cis-trans isomerase
VARERLDVSLAADTPGVKGFDFVACTGAVTENLFRNTAGRNKKEWDGNNNGRFELITFSFGGNNIGFDEIIKECIGLDAAKSGAVAGASSGGGVHGTLTSAAAAWLVRGGCPAEAEIRQRIDDLGRSGNTVEGERLRGYKEFLIDVANRVAMPGGNIVVVGYPELIEEAKFWPSANQALGICQGVRRGDAPVLRGTAGLLNQAIGEAVNQVAAQRPNGVSLTFVDVNTGNNEVGFDNPDLFEPSRGKRHNLCAAEPWLNGITTGASSGEFRPERSFHPTQEGHDHQGALVAARIKKLTWSGLTADRRSASVTSPVPIDRMNCPASDGSSPRITRFTKPPPLCIDVNRSYTAEVTTNKGRFVISLDARQAPNTVNNFVVLSRYHFYDGLTFHRIVPGFVVQGGDPEGTGWGGPGYTLADEPPKAGGYQVGSVVMARSFETNTNGSQFFIVTGQAGAELEPRFSLFGQVIKGLDVVRAIDSLGGPKDGKPIEEVSITSIRIAES